MDFRTRPSRDSYYVPPPQGHRPAAPLPSQPVKEAPNSPQAAVPSRRRLKSPKRSLKWKIIVIVVVLLGLVAWLANGYISTKKQLTQLSSNAKTSGQLQTNDLTDKVGKLVDLPVGETPTFATVDNASKLKNQAFFTKAKNGDKVLIYSKSHTAILYRPSTNKIIEYNSHINMGDTSAQ